MDLRQCRGCGAGEVTPVLDLGPVAPAHRYRTPDDPAGPEPRLPLRLALCPQCGLAQLADDPPPELLTEADRSDPGPWAAEPPARITGRHHLSPEDLILEVVGPGGSAAAEVPAAGSGGPVRLAVAGFTGGVARAVRRAYGPARLFVARRALAHAAHVHDFLDGVRHVLAPDGVAVVETPHLAAVFERGSFDVVQHRYLFYFSLAALGPLLERAGLRPVEVQPRPLLDGRLVLHIVHAASPAAASRRVSDVLRDEERLRLARPDSWAGFADRAARVKDELWTFFADMTHFGQLLGAYGASARANTMLAYLGLGRDHLLCLVDPNPALRGLLTPGHGLRIDGPDRLLKDLPDVTLILDYEEADAVVRQQTEYRRQGGRLASPVPVTRLVSVAAAA